MNSKLEEQFHQAMLQICAEEKAVRPRGGIRLRQWIERDDGLAAAKRSLRPSTRVMQGFQELCLAKRLDLTVEALVLREPWRALFTADELAIAKKRLDEVTPGGWQ